MTMATPSRRQSAPKGVDIDDTSKGQAKLSFNAFWGLTLPHEDCTTSPPPNGESMPPRFTVTPIHANRHSQMCQGWHLVADAVHIAISPSAMEAAVTVCHLRDLNKVASTIGLRCTPHPPTMEAANVVVQGRPCTPASEKPPHVEHRRLTASTKGVTRSVCYRSKLTTMV
jgi:hypothetical protein